jgi:cytidylate kinase
LKTDPRLFNHGLTARLFKTHAARSAVRRAGRKNELPSKSKKQIYLLLARQKYFYLRTEPLVVCFVMWDNINFEKCLSYINSNVATEAYTDSKVRSKTFLRSSDASECKIHPAAKPSITMSRMCGAGGSTVASQLVDFLQSHTLANRQWTIFNRNLIEKVLEDHHLSKRISEIFPEGHKSSFAATIEKMRGLHSPNATLVKQTAETVWNLATSGYVILIGRAANVITQKLDNVFHVRLVGSLKNRIVRVVEVHEMSRTNAREFIKSQDKERQHYVKEYFDREIDDPLLYHIIINTDEISYENAARLIGKAVIAATNRRQAQVLAAS